MLETNIRNIKERITSACVKAERPVGTVRIVAISKKHSAQTIREAFLCGIKDFGENYLQEALAKVDVLKDLNICWHFTGRLQTKKIKTIVQFFDFIHSVDNIDHIVEIEKRAQEQNKLIKIFLQINVAQEVTKGGVTTAQAKDFVVYAQNMPHIKLIGLMTMPPLVQDPTIAASYFRQLKMLQLELKKQFSLVELTELSMGTSDDFEIAIAEGATMIRLGTALLGERGLLLPHS